MQVILPSGNQILAYCIPLFPKRIQFLSHIYFVVCEVSTCKWSKILSSGKELTDNKLNEAKMVDFVYSFIQTILRKKKMLVTSVVTSSRYVFKRHQLLGSKIK